jgi:hypothetical protein
MAPTTPSGSWTTKEKRSLVAVDLVEGLGVIAQRADRLGNVYVERVLDRLTDIEALEHGERLSVALYQFGKRKEDALLLAIVKAAPASIIEGTPRRGHGFVDIPRIALADMVDHRAVARRYIVEGAAGDARLELAIDHGAIGQFDGAGDALEVGK